MDKGRLFRLAASYLGEGEVREGTPLYAALEGAAQHAVALALDFNAWDFALVRVRLVPEEAGVLRLPADCLEVRVVEGVPSWRVMGRYVVWDEGLPVEDVVVWYKSSKWADAVCLPDDEPLFCQGVALLLAGMVAAVVSGRADVGGVFEERAREVLYRARLKEARAGYSNDGLPEVYGKELVYGGDA